MTLTNRSYQAAEAARPAVERARLYAPRTEWTYSHHPHLTFFQGRFLAMWSNGEKDEDAPGQRVLVSASADFLHWTPPALLMEARPGRGRTQTVLTAAGWHQYAGRLAAYVGEYEEDRSQTRLFALTSADGATWTEPRDLHLPVIPNHGPQATRSGRLVIAGNFSFPTTNDPAGLSGWTRSGLQPGDLGDVSDNPSSFWKISKVSDWPTALCEGSFFQTDDGTLQMLLRSTGPAATGTLWLTECRDDGVSWSPPQETAFTDNDTKFHFGRLPDGRWYYVGCPDPKPTGLRSPLVLSVSENGTDFHRHFLLGDDRYERRRPGRWKDGQFGYPHTMVQDGNLCVIVSRRKEAVQVLRVALNDL